MTYTYECAAGVEFEAQQRITDPKLTTCPVCEKCTPRRLISPESGGFRLASGPSGGWSETGYAKPLNHRQAEAALGRPLTPKAT